MEIIEDIKIDFRTDFETTTIMTNSGVYKPDPNYVDGEIYYLENSYIPKDDWNIVNNDALNILTLDAKKNKEYSKIIIDKIPNKIKKLFLKMKFSEAKSRNDVFQKLADKQHLVLEIEREIKKHLSIFSLENNFDLYKILVLYPNRKTTAFVDFGNMLKFIGLHFDSCTTFEIETANTSKNRFCLNIGEEDRELYFVNLSLKHITELILEKNNNENVTLKTITPLFFKYYPNYPIVKLKIKPFEYYIAPTDNCIHDGTTLRKKEMDISITYLGYFNT